MLAITSSPMPIVQNPTTSDKSLKKLVETWLEAQVESKTNPFVKINELNEI